MFRSLQKIGSDLVNAMSTISATQSKLHTWCKDEESKFASMFEEAVLLAEKIGVTREDMHAIPRAVSQSVKVQIQYWWNQSNSH